MYQFRQTDTEFPKPAQTSSSSKNAGPPLRAKKMHSHLLISRSDLQCFSHEDECFAAGNRTANTVCLNCYKNNLNLYLSHPHILPDHRRFQCVLPIFWYFLISTEKSTGDIINTMTAKTIPAVLSPVFGDVTV